VRNAELAVELIGNVRGMELEGGVLGGQDHALAMQLLELCCHRAASNHRRQPSVDRWSALPAM
jgi:hypothetical protein